MAVIIGTTGDDSLLGTGAADTIVGLAGNDFLDDGGGAGADEMDGGTGNDTYYVNVAGDTVVEFSGEGTDQVRTTLNVLALANNVENLVFVGSGDFVGVGNSGDNLILGGAGNDQLTGGAGNNTLIGSGGVDVAVYETAPAAITVNLLNGTAANGYGGTDSLQQIENVIGSAFADTMTGDNGNNTLYGNDGDDVLSGGNGNDILIGGAGNDTLDGGTGRNDMIGGAGNDTYFVASNQDLIYEDVGGGTDTVKLSTTNGVYTLPANVENLTFIGGGTFTGTGNALDNVIIGGGNNDTIDGGAGADTMNGGAGSDTYYVDNAGDVIIDSSGVSDQVKTTLSSYTLQAGIEGLTYIGNGNFTGTASSGNSSLIGGSGDDVLTGLGGNDELSGGTGGNDRLVGGAGNNYYFGISLSSNETIDYSADPSAVNVNLSTGVGTNGYGGNDTYDTGPNANIVGVIGSAFDDVIVGSSRNNTLSGGGGNDLLKGLGGNNTYDGGAGTNTVDYSAAGSAIHVDLNNGNATANGYGGQDTFTNIQNITGSANDDVIVGSNVANQLVGGTGHDVLVGLGGDDVLDGGTGSANELQGGTGNDTYIVSVASDTITEFAGEGTDTVQTNLASFTLPANVENLTYTGSGNFAGTGNSAANVITGGSHDDSLTGAGGADRFVFSGPASGHDTITDFTADNASAGHDLIDLQGRGYTFGDLTIAASGSDTLITLHGGPDTILLVGVAPAQVDAGDFLF